MIPQNLYNQIVENVPIVCVDVVIIHNGSALLVRRNDTPAQGDWWVPGGRVFKLETMKEAAHRKAQDEVGIDCYIGPIVHTAETIFPNGVHSVNSCFFCCPKGEVKVTLDAHHSAYQWVNIIPQVHPYVEACLKGAGLTNNFKKYDISEAANKDYGQPLVEYD